MSLEALQSCRLPASTSSEPIRPLIPWTTYSAWPAKSSSLATARSHKLHLYTAQSTHAQARVFSTSSCRHLRIRVGPARKKLKDQARRLRKSIAKGEGLKIMPHSRSELLPRGATVLPANQKANTGSGLHATSDRSMECVPSGRQNLAATPAESYHVGNKHKDRDGMESLVLRLRQEKAAEDTTESDQAAAEREENVLGLILEDGDLMKRSSSDKRAAALDRIRVLMLKMEQPEEPEMDVEGQEEEALPRIRRHAALRLVNKRRNQRLKGQTEMKLDLKAIMTQRLPAEGKLNAKELSKQTLPATRDGDQSHGVPTQDQGTLNRQHLPNLDKGISTVLKTTCNALGQALAAHKNDHKGSRLLHTKISTNDHGSHMIKQELDQHQNLSTGHVRSADRQTSITKHANATEPGADIDSAGVTPQLRRKLTHVNDAGAAHMVSVSEKATTSRTATAITRVAFSDSATHNLVSSNALKKGDVLSVARVAGIMAAKHTSSLVPLCHPIRLSHVSIDMEVFGPAPQDQVDANADADRLHPNGGSRGGVWIEARCQCNDQTGVEIEALTAAMVTGLTVYDMCKAVDKRMSIDQAMVVQKSGGKSGDWSVPQWYSLKHWRLDRCR